MLLLWHKFYIYEVTKITFAICLGWSVVTVLLPYNAGTEYMDVLSWVHPSVVVTVLIVLITMQVIDWIPSNRRCDSILAISACKADPICHNFWFLPGSLWDYLLFLYPLLCGGRDIGNSHSQTTLFQEFLELSGCCDHCGRFKNNTKFPPLSKNMLITALWISIILKENLKLLLH